MSIDWAIKGCKKNAHISNTCVSFVGATNHTSFFKLNGLKLMALRLWSLPEATSLKQCIYNVGIMSIWGCVLLLRVSVALRSH